MESALRGVPDVTEPTLEWQMVRPADEKPPARRSGWSGARARPRDDAEVARKCAAALRERLGIDDRRRGPRPRDHPPLGVQGGPSRRRVSADTGTERRRESTGMKDDIHDLTLADVLRAPRRARGRLDSGRCAATTGSTSWPSTGASTSSPTPWRRGASAPATGSCGSARTATGFSRDCWPRPSSGRCSAPPTGARARPSSSS